MGPDMRFDGWPEILHAEIEAAQDKPFAWGKCDCCLFAADVVKAMTGTDYASEFRGKYKTAKGAARALIKYGHKTLSSTMNEKLPPVRFPKRGDVVMALVNGDEALGICIGSMCVFKSPDGVVQMPVSDIDAAWDVT